jgi:hypothetical protein
MGIYMPHSHKSTRSPRFRAQSSLAGCSQLQGQRKPISVKHVCSTEDRSLLLAYVALDATALTEWIFFATVNSNGISNVCTIVQAAYQPQATLRNGAIDSGHRNVPRCSFTGSTKHHFRHRASLSIVRFVDIPEHNDALASWNRQPAPYSWL